VEGVQLRFQRAEIADVLLKSPECRCFPQSYQPWNIPKSHYFGGVGQAGIPEKKHISLATNIKHIPPTSNQQRCVFFPAVLSFNKNPIPIGFNRINSRPMTFLPKFLNGK